MARRYRVAFTPAAQRELTKQTPAVRVRIQTAIDRLRTQPRPVGAAKLKGMDELLRIRVGDYRVIYRVIDDLVLVLVLRIGHRAEVYRAFALRQVRRRTR